MIDTHRMTVLDRRRHVASLCLRGMTQREIQKALAQEPINLDNPKNGQPWSVGTVNSDLKAIEAEWMKLAIDSLEQHKARRLAELAEVKRAAWAANDLDKVLRAIQQERDLLGLDKPKQTMLSGEVGLKHKVNEDDLSEAKRSLLRGLSDEDVAASCLPTGTTH